MEEGKDYTTTIDMIKWRHLENWNDLGKFNDLKKVVVVPGIEYAVQSFHTGLYEYYTTTLNTSLQKLMPFKKENRIYVKRKI